jgi:2-iminobutanoate/2-iminopropanoate deaminase
MKPIETTDAPESIGPFSQAVVDGDRIYVSGQGPVDPETDEVVSEDIHDQTARTLANIEAILTAADASLDDVLKTRVYVTDMDSYDAVNEVYAEYFSSPYPARCAVEVSRLPIDIGVEIEAVATTV